MAKNSGKRFEEDFNISCEVQNLCITRLYDTMGGFTAVSNICDYINYLYPNIFYMELKSTATGTLPLNHISKNQKDGLTNKTKYDGVIPGVLIKYSKFDEHYFVHINELNRLAKTGAKSISRNHIKNGDIEATPMYGTKKIVTYVYDVEDLLRRLIIKYGKQL